MNKRSDSIDLFLDKYFKIEKGIIDKIYVKHQKMIFRCLDPKLKEQLDIFLQTNKPTPNIFFSPKGKKQAEKQFDLLFYKESEGKEKEITYLAEKRKKEAIENSDKLSFHDSKLLDSIDLYNNSPYKVELIIN
jgi:hypothetical protein